MCNITRRFALSFPGGMQCPADADWNETAAYCSALCRWCTDCFEKAVLQGLCRSLLAGCQKT